MFIVLEGIDGAGKGHQRIEVSDYLSKEFNLDIKGEEFPVHNAFYETVIHPALQEEVKMNKASWVLSYLLDKTLASDQILDFIGNKDKHFIADGYFTTTLAYQGYLTKQVPIDRLLEYATDFEIPKPDLCIFLDVDPKIAFERKEKEEGHDEGLDMFEKDLSKQEELRKIFNQMIEDEIYCKWKKIDGNGSSKDVTNDIIAVLQDEQIIS